MEEMMERMKEIKREDIKRIKEKILKLEDIERMQKSERMMILDEVKKEKIEKEIREEEKKIKEIVI